ncbi:MAG TPA: PAS domain S-box protein, partial [Steroidobacteraceae bacterium]|nr:PAS domain S-box protein [Steroidobacteraceae bacterium]
SGNAQSAHSVADLYVENAKLREALRLGDCALDATPSGIVIIDMQRSGRPIVYANLALVKRTGYSKKELIGMPSATLTPRDSNPESTLQIRDAMQAGRQLRIEYQTARKDGSLYWTGTTLVPVLDANRRVTHYVSLSADITARRDEELQSRRDRQRLAAIVESAMEGIVAVDNTFRITLFNQAAETIFGRSSAEMLGRPLDILIPERYRGAHGEHIRRFAGSNISIRKRMGASASVMGLRSNGEEFPLAATISRVSVENDIVLIVMCRDISEEINAQRERAQLESQLRLAQKLESVGQLAAGIAHEINTPIQYVGDSVSFLQTSRDDGLLVLKAYRDGIAAL